MRRAISAVGLLYGVYFLALPHLVTWAAGLSPRTQMVLSLTVVHAVLLLLVALLTPRGGAASVLGLRAGKLPFGLITGGAVGYVFLALVLGFIMLIVFQLLRLPVESARQQALTLALTSSDPVIRLLMPLQLAIVAPLLEELFFRGLVYGSLRPRGRSLAAVTAAVSFAFIHLEPVAFVAHAGLGVYLAWLRERTGSVWAAVLTHALANTSLYALVELGTQLA